MKAQLTEMREINPQSASFTSITLKSRHRVSKEARKLHQHIIIQEFNVEKSLGSLDSNPFGYDDLEDKMPIFQKQMGKQQHEIRLIQLTPVDHDSFQPQQPAVQDFKVTPFEFHGLSDTNPVTTTQTRPTTVHLRINTNLSPTDGLPPNTLNSPPPKPRKNTFSECEPFVANGNSTIVQKMQLVGFETRPRLMSD